MICLLFQWFQKDFTKFWKSTKSFTSAVTLSKRILNFDTDYFNFLKCELRCLRGEIRKKFEERIVKSTFVFSLIDIHLGKIVYDLLLFRIFYHCFFCATGSESVRKCDVCSRFFVDDSVIASKINQEFLLSKNGIRQLPICELMKQVNARSVVLNLYYLVREYAGNGKWTENFGKIFFEITIEIVRLVFTFSIFKFIWECFLISWGVSLKSLLTFI